MRLIKIGRAPDCDIVLQSAQVSSLHAEITILNSGDILLEDKGSRNGTMVANQPIQPGKSVSVRRGDMITFAGVPLNWSDVPMPEDNSAYRGVFGIGSNFQNEIQISGKTVSRFHATVKVGKDNKVYIVDHSKNGTTVNGTKIPSNAPYRIKKSSAVVCGGVPVDLSRVIPWPAEVWKWVIGIAATIAVVAGLGFGIYKFVKPGGGVLPDQELYARYNTSAVMLMGVYHYEITAGNYDLDKINDFIGRLGKEFHIPQKVLWINDQVVDVSSYSQKQLIEATDKCGFYSATGFFISNDGQIITNLHVVKPWLFDDAQQQIQDYYTQLLATATEYLNTNVYGATGLSAAIPQVKVVGKLDYIALLPQGATYDPDNIQKCKPLSAGDETDKDVALIQTVSKQLPAGCTYVNVTDSMDISDEAYTVGEHVYTIGFPTGMKYAEVLQKSESENGIQVVAQPGDIIQKVSEFDFGYNAASTGGASGSPVFNKYGMLIGVHHQGLSSAVTQGYNYGVKAKYIKELLDNPHSMGSK